jgi:sarcosine oxidase subunit alpha
VLAALKPDFDISRTAFPHMSFREGAAGGVVARVSRVSFTGELQYEINVPASKGDALLRRLMEIAEPMGGCLVGLEAWLRLRLEKGYLHVGADTNGRTTPLDLGMGGIIDKKPGDFIGRRSLSLAYAVSGKREQLVGIKCTAAALKAGGRILADGDTRPPCRSEGYVTSACFSPSLGFHVGLALLENGSKRMGATVRIYDGGNVFEAEVCRPGAYDPDNERLMA